VNGNESERGNVPKARRWAAVAEVTAVTALGLPLAVLVAGLLGWRPDNPIATLQSVPQSWLPAAWAVAKLLLAQYAGQFALAAAFLLARREFTRRRLGLTLHARDAAQGPLVLVGMAALAALVMFPLVRGLLQAGITWELLPPGPPWRAVLLDAPLSWDFWVFMAVFSFGLLPVLEELFFRGYVQGRLQQVLSPGAAVAVTSTLFTLLHGQYHGVDAFSIATIASLFILSVVLGVLYQRSGSLLPPILLHALINLPMNATAVVAVAFACVVGAIAFRRPLTAAMRDLAARLSPRCLGLHGGAMLAAVAGFVLLLRAQPSAGFAVAAGLLLYAIGYGLLRRAAPTNQTG